MLDIKLINKGQEAELLVEGKIDSSVAVELQKQLLNVAERFQQITLNLAALTYISSAGLRSLKSLRNAMRNKGGTIRIKNVRKDVKDVFVITGFYKLFDFEE